MCTRLYAVPRLAFGSLVCPILAGVGHFHMAHSSWPKMYSYKIRQQQIRNAKPSNWKRSLFLSHFSLRGWLADCWGISICSNSLDKYNLYIFFICLAAAIWIFFRISRRCGRCHFVLSLAATFPLNVYFTLQYCVCTSFPLLGARMKQSEMDNGRMHNAVLSNRSWQIHLAWGIWSNFQIQSNENLIWFNGNGSQMVIDVWSAASVDALTICNLQYICGLMVWRLQSILIKINI